MKSPVDGKESMFKSFFFLVSQNEINRKNNTKSLGHTPGNNLHHREALTNITTKQGKGNNQELRSIRSTRKTPRAKKPAIFRGGMEPTKGIHFSPNPKENLITNISNIKSSALKEARVPFPPNTVDYSSEHQSSS